MHKLSSEFITDVHATMRHAGLARWNSKCIILACVIPRKRSDPLTRVKLPHSLSRLEGAGRGGRLVVVSNVGFQTIFPPRSYVSTIPRETGSGLIRSLPPLAFPRRVATCPSCWKNVTGCDWINICTMELYLSIRNLFINQLVTAFLSFFLRVCKWKGRNAILKKVLVVFDKKILRIIIWQL